MKKLFVILLCVTLVTLIELKIYSFYTGFVAAEKELLATTLSKIEELQSDSPSEEEERLEYLATVLADREYEIYVVTFFTLLSMCLFALAAFGPIVAYQLTRKGSRR